MIDRGIIRRIAASRLWQLSAVIPSIALVASLSWFGVFTFVNAYLTGELGYSNAEWTAATLWFSGSMIIWPLVCTEISPRLGRRRTVASGIIVAALCFAGIGLFHHPWVIRLLLVLMAYTQGAFAVAWTPMVAEAGGENPGRALAVANMVSNIVSAAALIGSGYLIHGLHYTHAFLIISAIFMLCAVAFMFLSRPLADVAARKAVNLRQLTRDDVRILIGPFAVLLALGIAMEPFNYHTMNQLFPNLARGVHALSATTISTTVALGRMPALLTLLVLANVIDRLPKVRCYGIAILLTGGAVMLTGFAAAPWVAVLGYGCYYLFHGAVWGTNTVSINAAVPPHLRDAAFAITNAVAIAAMFGVGVIHNRMLAAGWTLPMVFIWCGILGITGGLLLFAYSFLRHDAHRAVVPAVICERNT